MLSSITPLGERGRSSRWGLTVAAYLLGSLLAGAVFGGVLGGIGQSVSALLPEPLPGVAVLLVLAVLAVVGVALDANVGGLRLPTVRRQVNEDWLVRYRGWVYGAGFGAQLGLGVVTIVTTSAVYLLWSAALLSSSYLAGSALGAIFGLARALPILAMWRVTTPAALGDAFVHLEAARRSAHVAALAGLGLVAASAALPLLTS